MTEMHVLHVIDPEHDGDEATLACLNVVRTPPTDPGTRHSVWLLGTQATEDRVATLGLRRFERVCASRRPARAIAGVIRKIAAAQRDDLDRAPTVVQAWGERAIRLTRAGFLHEVPVVGAVLRPPLDSEPVDPAVTIVAPTAELARCWTRPTTPHARTIRFGAPIPAPAFHDDTWGREALRTALGVSVDRPLILLPGAPPTLAQTRRFVFMLGLISAGGIRATGLVPGGAADGRRAARAMRSHHRRWILRVSDTPLPLLLDAADLIVWDPGRQSIPPTGLPMLREFARQRPIVAPDCPLVREVTDGTTPAHRLMKSGAIVQIGSGVINGARDLDPRSVAPIRAFDDDTDHTLFDTVWREAAALAPARDAIFDPEERAVANA